MFGHNEEDLPFELLQLIDRHCRQMEREMQAGGSVCIEALIADAPAAHRDALLGELLSIELGSLHAREESPGLKSYLSRFPDQGDVVRWAFDQETASREV